MSVAWFLANKPSEADSLGVWRSYFEDCPRIEWFEMCVAGILVEHGARLHLPEKEKPFYNFAYRFSDGPFAGYNMPNPFDLSSRMDRRMAGPLQQALTESVAWNPPEDRNLYAWICSVLRNSEISLIPPERAIDFAKLPAEIRVYRYLGVSTPTAYGSPTFSISNLDNAVRGFHWSLSSTCSAVDYGGHARKGWRKFRASAVVEKAAITGLHWGPDEEVTIGRPDLIPAHRIELTEISPDPRNVCGELEENEETTSDSLARPAATALQPEGVLPSGRPVDRPQRPVLIGALGDPRLLLQPNFLGRF